MPHTHACTCLVIGRVTPGGENVAPDRALNSVDFPLPVPPARATTVWLPDRRSRSPARLSTASASSSSVALKPLPSSLPARAPAALGALALAGPADPDQFGERVEAPRQVLLGHPLRADRGEACSSGRLERVLGLVQPDGGDRVDRAGLVEDLAEAQQLLVEQQPDPLAAGPAWPGDQRLGLGVAR